MKKIIIILTALYFYCPIFASEIQMQAGDSIFVNATEQIKVSCKAATTSQPLCNAESKYAVTCKGLPIGSTCYAFKAGTCVQVEYISDSIRNCDCKY